MAAIAGRLVRTPGAPLAYKVVLEHDDMTLTEQAVASCREGEALIREALGEEAAPRPRFDPWNPPLILAAQVTSVETTIGAQPRHDA